MGLHPKRRRFDERSRYFVISRREATEKSCYLTLRSVILSEAKNL